MLVNFTSIDIKNPTNQPCSGIVHQSDSSDHVYNLEK